MRNTMILLFILPLVFGCVSTKNANTFTKAGLLSGSVMTEGACSDPDTSLWVTVSGKGECVRYFHTGLKDDNDIVHVWLHGDRIRRTRDGNVAGGYSEESPQKQQHRATHAFQETTVPTILLSRPGSYGSSGFHTQRRRPRNVNIVLEAITTLKEKYKINRFAISGQSG